MQQVRALVIIVILASAAGAQTTPQGFMVIVHPRSPVTRLDRRFLAEIFFRRTTRWTDDTPIRPVDQVPDSPARGRFTQDVLARSVASVRSYWQQRIFSGQGLPPPELNDDEAVVGYVASHPGAIGYVAPGTRTAGARAVEVD